MRPLLSLVAVLATAAAAPAAASAQATLSVDPQKTCYREQETVDLIGAGFSPNGPVDFSRGGESLGELAADPGGTVFGELELPGLVSGEQSLTYSATDLLNPALVAQVMLLVTATDVEVRPQRGAPDRLLSIDARGFTTGPTLYAHVRRVGGGRVRNVRIGALEGPCGKVAARKRLLGPGADGGRYRVQFDTFRRFAPREVETSFVVTVSGPGPRRPRGPQTSPPPPPPPRPPQPRVDCQGYSPCIPPGPDVDCAGGSGNGPRYVDGPVFVRGDDPYGLDSDGDRVACES